MSCRTGCRTQDCASYAACLKGANFQIDRYALRHGAAGEKDKNHRLTRYADARSGGLQPRSTKWSDIRSAEETGGVPHTPVVERAPTVQEVTEKHAIVRPAD